MKNFTRYRIIEFLELLAGSVLPILFWTSLIFGFDAPYVAILTVTSALVHELSHIVTICLLGGKELTLKGHSTGFRIPVSDMLSYRREILVFLSGPAANILIFFLTLPFQSALMGYIGVLGYINLATGISNLLPIEGYDGYGALSTLCKSLGSTKALKHLECFSFIFSILITFVSLHLIDVFGEGYWIFGLFFITVLSKIIKMEKYDVLGE